MSARRVWARSFWLCIPWGLCHPTQLFTWLEVNAAVSRTALPVSHRSLGARRDCPLCGRALPLFKVVCARLDILCLQHEPGIFQDCLAHLQRSHTAEKTRSLIDLPSFLPSPGLGPEALGELRAPFLQQIFFRIQISLFKRGGGEKIKHIIRLDFGAKRSKANLFIAAVTVMSFQPPP